MGIDCMYADYAMRVGGKADAVGLKFKIRGEVYNELRFNILLADYAMRVGGKAGEAGLKFKFINAARREYRVGIHMA